MSEVHNFPVNGVCVTRHRRRTWYLHSIQEFFCCFLFVNVYDCACVHKCFYKNTKHTITLWPLPPMNPLWQLGERIPCHTTDSSWMSRWSECNTRLLGSQSLASPHYVAQGQQNTDRRWVITHLAFPMAAPWPNEINQRLTWVRRPEPAGELPRKRVPSLSWVDYFLPGFSVQAIFTKAEVHF